MERDENNNPYNDDDILGLMPPNELDMVHQQLEATITNSEIELFNKPPKSIDSEDENEKEDGDAVSQHYDVEQ